MGSDPFYDNVCFRWKAAVDECLLNTESGRPGRNYDSYMT